MCCITHIKNIHTKYDSAYLLYKITGIMMNITTEVIKSTAATPPAVIIISELSPTKVKADK